MVNSNYIGIPPAEKIIPVTRGCDRSFTIQRVDSGGDPIDFDPATTVYMWIDIQRSDPTRVDAVVSGALAAFSLQSTVCDLVRDGTRWRVVLDLGSDVELPLLVGKFERYDG